MLRLFFPLKGPSFPLFPVSHHSLCIKGGCTRAWGRKAATSAPESAVGALLLRMGQLVEEDLLTGTGFGSIRAFAEEQVSAGGERFGVERPGQSYRPCGPRGSGPG